MYENIVVSAALCLWRVKETASAVAVWSYLLLFVFLPMFFCTKVRVRSPLESLLDRINVLF